MALLPCPDCSHDVSDRASSCPNCGGQPTPKPCERHGMIPCAICKQPSPNKVVVKDIEMSFGSMMKFMIMWALAAIPALIILFIIGLVMWGALLVMIQSGTT